MNIDQVRHIRQCKNLKATVNSAEINKATSPFFLFGNKQQKIQYNNTGDGSLLES